MENKKKTRLKNNKSKKDFHRLTKSTDFLTQTNAVFEKKIKIPSSFVYILPKEIWVNHIYFFLEPKDVHNLRVTCQWFRKEVIIYPLWKQWVPFEVMEFGTLEASYSKLGWAKPHVYGIYFSSPRLALQVGAFQTLHPSLRGLDLSGVTLPKDFLYFIPPSIERLILSYVSPAWLDPFKILYEFNPSLVIDILRGEGKNSFTQSLFYFCCGSYLEEFIRFLLESGREKHHLNQRDIETGETPLSIACKTGSFKTVEILLQYGSDPNIPELDSKYYSFLNFKKVQNHTFKPMIFIPLHIAITRLQLPLISLLLASGANIFQKDRTGKTALDIAQELKNEDIIQLLTAHISSQKQ